MDHKNNSDQMKDLLQPDDNRRNETGSRREEARRSGSSSGGEEACRNGSSSGGEEACRNGSSSRGEDARRHGAGSRGEGSNEGSSHSHPFKRRHSNSSSAEDSPADAGRKLNREPGCHMELDKLQSSPDHTVLIDTDTFHIGKLVPYPGKHVWDNSHVKLPDLPKSGHEPRWKVMQRALHGLTKGKATVKDVQAAILSYNHTHKSEWKFDALRSYVQHVRDYDNSFSSVIARTAKLALQLPEYIRHPIPLLRQNHSRAITLSQVQISCLLANAFFCTFPHRNSTKHNSEYSSFPTINFSSLFGLACGRKTQKLRALFHYFNTVTDERTKPDGLVTFERICIPENELPHWKTKKETLTNLHVSSEGFIEKEGRGMLQVDFACKFIGGGVLGRGLVQEEIRFILSPELIVARLFTEQLADNECLKITGAQTFSTSSGYSDSFEWEGPYEDKTDRDEWKRRFCQIVAIDALSFKNPREQYTKENLKRELNKAYVGFIERNTPPEYTPAIATGNWGCGAFNGDPKLKALIQMMAAAVAKRDMAFFTFGNKDQAQELRQIHDLLKTHKVTVGALYEQLKNYCDNYRRHHGKNVFEYIREVTPRHPSQL